MVSSLLRMAVLLAASLSFAVSAAEDPDALFAQASAAFSGGDYSRALELFEAARASGVEGPAVPYNIGVCQFKLGRYAVAEREFAALAARFPSMAGIAAYNRGLALLELEREDEALAAFSTARASGDDKISALATDRLAELGEAPVARAPTASWTGLLDASVGYDDNVALVDELTLPAGQSGESSLVEVLAFATRSAGPAVPLRVDLSAYAVRYPDAGEFDQTSLAVGAAFERRTGPWRLEIGPHYDRGTLGGNDFEAEFGVGARAQRSVGERSRLAFALAYDDVSALDSQFDFLEGSQWRLGVSLLPRVDGFRVSYDIELNDRVTAGASPDRQRAAVGYRRRVAGGWQLDGVVSYRWSSYDVAGGSDERLGELRVGAGRDLVHGWRLAFAYRRSHNDADIAAYSYTGNRLAATIGKTF